MTNLPTWAQSRIARALLSEIIANPPAETVSRDDWGSRDTPRYRGPLASKLRQLHGEWLEAEYARLDSAYAISGVWNGDYLRYIEDADSLIGRVLGEGSGQREAA